MSTDLNTIYNHGRKSSDTSCVSMPPAPLLMLRYESMQKQWDVIASLVYVSILFGEDKCREQGKHVKAT